MNIKDSINLPQTFQFPKFTRYFTLVLGVCVIIYSLFFLFTQINSDSAVFKKILPFIIMFFAYDSVSRNLFSLNKIILTQRNIQFSCIAKKTLIINWEDMLKLESYLVKGKFFLLHYSENGVEKKYYFPMAFKNIIEIINFIKQFSPHLETDEFVKSLIFLPKEKELETEGDKDEM